MLWFRNRKRLARLERTIHWQNRRIANLEYQMATLDDLRAAVAKDKELTDQVVTFITDVKTKLEAAVAASDPVAMQAIIDDLNANNAKLATVVTSV